MLTKSQYPPDVHHPLRRALKGMSQANTHIIVWCKYLHKSFVHEGQKWRSKDSTIHMVMLVLLAMILRICKYVCMWGIDTFEVWPHGKATVNPFLTHPSNSFHTIHHRSISPPDSLFGCADQEREREKAMQAAYHSTPEETQAISVPIFSDLTPRLHPHSQTIFFTQREKIVWWMAYFCSKHHGGGTQIRLLFVSDM